MKVLARIQKLLSLAGSDNEHEAKSAMDKANELLVKHNITMQQATETVDYNRDILEESKRSSVEDKFVHSILKEFFFVKIVNRRTVGKKVTFIIGSETNVQVATYVHGYLKNTFKSLFSAYRKETGCPANYRQSYYMGLFNGLKEQLTKTKTNTEASVGLVLVPDQELNTYMEELFPNLKSSKNSVPLRSGQAVSDGRAEGQRLRISRGIESRGEQGLSLRAAK